MSINFRVLGTIYRISQTDVGADEDINVKKRFRGNQSALYYGQHATMFAERLKGLDTSPFIFAKFGDTISLTRLEDGDWVDDKGGRYSDLIVDDMVKKGSIIALA